MSALVHVLDFRHTYVHPVTAGTQSDAIRSIGHGPDLCDDNPGACLVGLALADTAIDVG